MREREMESKTAKRKENKEAKKKEKMRIKKIIESDKLKVKWKVKE